LFFLSAPFSFEVSNFRKNCLWSEDFFPLCDCGKPCEWLIPPQHRPPSPLSSCPSTNLPSVRSDGFLVGQRNSTSDLVSNYLSSCWSPESLVMSFGTKGFSSDGGILLILIRFVRRDWFLFSPPPIPENFVLGGLCASGFVLFFLSACG